MTGVFLFVLLFLHGALEFVSAGIFWPPLCGFLCRNSAQVPIDVGLLFVLALRTGLVCFFSLLTWSYERLALWGSPSRAGRILTVLVVTHSTSSI
ncbi:hypothetical protein QBC37DRAFT_409033 [Rhypophila decipiens]|uniref:Uncharacterized protein n=1 Tax=Rhypophila decipiens TaxID=261697 RepID=A0AAN7BDI9_9PEZI|nr:hypothetical protein QBC37DRAFT_409033 [Rhypophila decipiens]